MWNVFVLQWKRLFKKPLLILFFIGLTILFVYFLGGSQVDSNIIIPVYTKDLTQTELAQRVNRLDETDDFSFEETTYEEAEEEIRMNQLSFALEVNDDTYRFLVGRETEQFPAVNQYVSQIYRQEALLEDIQAEYPEKDIEIEEFITVTSSHARATGEIQKQYQIPILIGMTFYFTIYSILFLQINFVEEKRTGTWNRMIFSPVSKVQIYLGHLAHYYLVGLGQIGLSFFILVNLLGVDLGDNYLPMIVILLVFLFTIVSLGLFLAAAVPTAQSLQVVIPIITTAMAMVGGAFWPLEIVSNRFILFLSEFTPIKHALYGMIDAIQYDYSLIELAEPIGILLLMGIIFMGIGINLMERVSTK